MYPMIRDDFGSSDTPAAQEERQKQQPVGYVEELGAQAGQTTGDVTRFLKHKLEPEPLFHEGEIQSPDELNKQYNLKGENQFKTFMPSDTAKEMVTAMERRKKAEEVQARFAEQHSYPAQLATGLIGSLLDPVEDAAMFVPGIGEERIAYKLATMGYGRHAAAFMSKVGAGASAGMTGAAALEPLKAIMSEDELREWTLREAATDVFSAAPMGALMHAGLVPAMRAGASFVTGVKPEPYIPEYSFWDKDQTTPEALAKNVRAGVFGGVNKAFDAELDKRPPSPGYINELDRMGAIERHVFMSSTFAQMMTGKEMDAGKWMFPDHTEEARKLNPEAHAEWDKLQEELGQITAGHVWGEPPTPEQANDPAWKLEQQLREHTKNILPVSWDLRVAAMEGDKKPEPLKPEAETKIEAMRREREELGKWIEDARNRGDAGWRQEHYDKRVAELDKTIKEEETARGNARTELETKGVVDKDKPVATTDETTRARNIETLGESDAHPEGEILAYHGTDSGEQFDKFKITKKADFGLHFGTREQAGKFVRPHSELDEEHSPRIYPVVIDMKNVMEMPDLQDWEPNDVVRNLHGKMPDNEYKDLLSFISRTSKLMEKADEADDGDTFWRLRSSMQESIIKSLIKNGYDGVRYRNSQEGEGWSYIAFKPGTVKSALSDNRMYNFGGVKAANPPKGLNAAKRMEQRGERRENIWRETGWHRSPSGGWRFEINDSKAELSMDFLNHNKKTDSRSGTITLDKLYISPETYEQYPDLKDIVVKISITPNSVGKESGLFYHFPDKNGVSVYVKSNSVEKAKRTLSHEIQHAIQHREGELDLYAKVSSSDNAHMHPKYKEMVSELRKAIGVKGASDLNYMLRYAIYQHLKEEIEARIADRRSMTSEYDRTIATPFAHDMDFHHLIPPVVQNVVSRVIGTDIFDPKAYHGYLQSQEFKDREKAIEERKARIREALDKLKSDPEADRIKAEKAAEAERARVEAERAKEAEAARKAEEKKRLAAIKRAEARAVKAEAEAVRVQKELEKLEGEIRKIEEAQEKARQKAEKAEADLKKADERLESAKQIVESSKEKIYSLEKEMDDLTSETESAKMFIEGEERDRLNAARAREGETIVAQGMTDPNARTVWISAMALDPKLISREESGHAIRASGLFKPEEWSIMRDAAINRGWIDDMPENVRKRYEEAYAGRGADGVRDAMIEEAIMHRFAKGPEAWGEPGGIIHKLMQRIKEMLERIGNWMTSRGFQSANDVFHAMESGKVAGRETMAPHPARRMKEIEGRMEELKPSILEAYETAKANSPHDIPSLATLQRNKAKWGEAPAMPTNEVAAMLSQIYGPKEVKTPTPAKEGEVPVELQLDEQRLQDMMGEGYAPDKDEITQHAETTRALQEAMAMEAGYQQAAECLISAGFR